MAPRTALAALVATCCVVLGACRSGRGGANPAELARELEPPTAALGAFGHFELLPMEVAPFAASDQRRIVEGARVEAKLVATFAPTLDAWNAEGRDGPSLRIQPRLVNLHTVRRRERTWRGALPGEWTVDLELLLTDAATGTLVARPRVQGASDRIPGSWSPGDTDRDLVDLAVEVLHAYVVAHRDGRVAPERVGPERPSGS